MSVVAAQRLATDLRRDLEITGRNFDLPKLLRDMEIEVCFEKPGGGSAEAMSDAEGEGRIFVNPNSSERRLRFTLGHELGHVLLNHGATACTAGDIHGRSKHPEEEEADAFCANLLLPARLFRQDIRSVHLRTDELSALADRYCVSLTATAIRFAQFTSDACAVIGVRPPAAPWIAKSSRVGWWLTLPPQEGTLISEHLNEAAASSVSETPAQLWIEEFPWREETLVTEEVVQTSANTWLVLLSEFPDPDDDPDLIDREAEEELERRRRSFRRY